MIDHALPYRRDRGRQPIKPESVAKIFAAVDPA
jgi:hypothetical protein